MLRFLSFKYLALLLVAVVAVAAIGNAAALTLDAAGQNVVEGQSNAFVADAGTVAYTIDSNGDVTATVTGLTDDFTAASGSLTGTAASFVVCDTATANTIICVFPTATLNAGTELHIVATTDS